MVKFLSMPLMVALFIAYSAGVSAEETPRDPFWPVGYAPKVVASKSDQEEKVSLDLSRLSAEQQAIIKSHMRVGGILRQGNQRLAIINSDVVKEGDDMKITVDGQSYTFHIKSLRAQNIVLEPKQDIPQPEER